MLMRCPRCLVLAQLHTNTHIHTHTHIQAPGTQAHFAGWHDGTTGFGGMRACVCDKANTKKGQKSTNKKCDNSNTNKSLALVVCSHPHTPRAHTHTHTHTHTRIHRAYTHTHTHTRIHSNHVNTFGVGGIGWLRSVGSIKL